MKTATKLVVGLWLDRTSEVDDPQWIVSRDRLDADGGAVTTVTISMHDDYDDARAAAFAYARREQIATVVETDEHGETQDYEMEDYPWS